MRLRSTGDRHEVRQQYVPALWSSLIQKLQVEGKEAVPDIIELMDSYFLTRDDWDAIMELGVGRMDMEKVRSTRKRRGVCSGERAGKGTVDPREESRRG